MIMRAHVAEFNVVCERILKKEVQQAAELFVHASKDLTASASHKDFSVPLDFEILEQLFRIDQALLIIDRTTFWDHVSKVVPPFPFQDIELFMHLAKSLPPIEDTHRANQLKQLSEQHPNLPGLQYLFALALQEEGAQNACVEKLKTSLRIFETLSPFVKNTPYSLQEGAFARRRVIALLHYFRCLPSKKALDLLNSVFKEGWANQTGNLYDHLLTRRESLLDILGLEKQVQETLEHATRRFECTAKQHEETIKTYEKRHLEIIGLFFVVVTIAVGGLQVLHFQQSISDSLILLAGLSFSLIGALSIGFAFLAQKVWPKIARLSLGIVALAVLFGLIYFKRPLPPTTPPSISTQVQDAAGTKAGMEPS